MFKSIYRKVWSPSSIKFPEFTGVRIMMMPVSIGNFLGVPKGYYNIYRALCSVAEYRFHYAIGYLTIDEKELNLGETLRRPGLHVDGYYHGKCGAWGGGGSWGSVGNGMLTISNVAGCVAYLGRFDGEPGPEGGCDHLKLPEKGELLEAGQIYWLDGACVHESVPAKAMEPIKRQWVRLSLPSNGPWFDGYTPNPDGVKPSGEILPRRAYLDTL